jgi:hypothetical protein
LAASLAVVASGDWSATFGSPVEGGAAGVGAETLEMLFIGGVLLMRPADIWPSVTRRRPTFPESIR